MRQRFDQQLHLGVQPISEVQLPLRSRDELPPILGGLQYIFTTPSLNEKIFALLEEKICEGKKKTGRKGMACPALCGGLMAYPGPGCSPSWTEH